MRRPEDHDAFQIYGTRTATRTAGRWVFRDHEHVLWHHEDRLTRPSVAHMLAIELTLAWLRRSLKYALWRYWMFPVLLGGDIARARRIEGTVFQWRWVFGLGGMKKARHG